MTARFHLPSWTRTPFAFVFCLGLAGFLLIIPVTARAQGEDYWTYLLHRETLASPLPYEVAHFSSFDRTGGNDDYATWYGTDPDGFRILCDTTGPGVVAHFWMTILNLPDTLRWKIYVDNMSVPLINATARELFGHLSPFVNPLADSMNYARYSYVPIPFQQRIKITSTHNGALYYHINVLLFPSNWTVEPMTMPPSAGYLARLDTLRQIHLQPAEPLLPGETVESSIGTQIVAAGQTVTLLGIAQSGTCRRVMLWLDQHTQAVNDSLWISMYVDNYPLPMLSGPVCSLFGAALGWRPYQSAVTGMSGDSVYFNLPFPFRSALRFDVTNRSSQVRTATVRAEVVPQPPTSVRPLRLHSIYHDRTPSIAWTLYDVFDVPGPGNFVGIFWQMYGSNHSTIEGDERFYFNHQPSASWIGTGTEDYFNGGYFWTNENGQVEPFQLSLHGVLGLSGGRAAAYRWQVADPIPFAGNLRMTLETGGYSQFAVNYRTSALIFARIPRWVVRDGSGDGALNYGESLEILGYGLTPGAELTNLLLGTLPLEFQSGSLTANSDSILHARVRAPLTGAGTYPITAIFGGQPETLAASYALYDAPRLSVQPLRLDPDTLVFRGDTLAIRCDGISPGETATVMASGLPFTWTGASPTADSTGAVSGNVVIPPGLPTGNLTVTAVSNGVPDAEADHLLKHRRYYRLETEIMQVAGWHGEYYINRWATLYTMPNQSYPWGRNIIRYLHGLAVGDSITFSFVFPDSGNFRFAYFFGASGGAGIIQILIDGTVDHAGLDTYAPDLGWRTARMDTVYTQWRTLNAGPHVLTFKVTGRNPSSTGWDIWTDQIIILQEYPESGVGDNDAPVAGGYALDQNYPNPFNPSTRVRFAIPRTERVTIKVYDVLGRQSAVLADQVFTSGEHFLTWDCSGCTSGVYFLKLSTPSHQMVRKAVVLR